jgi:putative transposase
LSAELGSYLAQEKAESAPERPKNGRNGHSRKTIRGEFGKTEIGIVRD